MSKTAHNRKWTYWHKVVEVDRKNPQNFKVGQILGMSEKHQKDWMAYDKETRGFYVAARLEYLGRLPYQLEESDPKEAYRRITAGEWS
jgi:hypothetical protein